MEFKYKGNYCKDHFRYSCKINSNQETKIKKIVNIKNFGKSKKKCC